MIPHSPAFAAAVNGPHTVITRVDVLSASGVILESGLPVAAGAVQCSSSSDSRRRSDRMIVRPDTLLGALPALLRPEGTELRVWSGIGWPLAAEEMICLATLGIEKLDVDQGLGTATVSGYDRLKRVARARFLFDRVAPSRSVLNNIRILWREAVPQAPDVVVDADVTDVLLDSVPTWQRDRLAAMKDMAASLSAQLVVEPMGNLRVSRIPDPQGRATTPVFTPANVLNAVVSQSREGVFNAVVVESQSGTGQPVKSDPIKDLNPLSPTRFDALGFGEVPGFVSLDNVRSKDQANLAADGQLRRVLGLRATLTVDTMPNPALSEDDIVPVRLPGSVDQHVLDSVTIGLGAEDAVSASTRVTTSTDVS